MSNTIDILGENTAEQNVVLPDVFTIPDDKLLLIAGAEIKKYRPGESKAGEGYEVEG
ncbi:MAG: hypothetical protein ACTHMM_13520 [Agriterribacter sp.]